MPGRVAQPAGKPLTVSEYVSAIATGLVIETVKVTVVPAAAAWLAGCRLAICGAVTNSGGRVTKLLPLGRV